MENIRTVNKAASTLHEMDGAVNELPPSLIVLLAAVAGLAVATIYYTQPMLAVIGRGLGTGTALMGLVPMLTQLGYALGILFLAPLGDRLDRRNIILVKSAVLAVALFASAFSQGIVQLLAASFVVGLAATLAQDIVSSAASLSPDRSRGRVVGSVMTGLLLGILLSRVVSGLVAEQFGWRAMLEVAGLSVVMVLVLAWKRLPKIAPTTRLSYGSLLASLTQLWMVHPSLRKAALTQGLLAIGFSAFWSTLAPMLAGAPFHLGSSVAGAFGLVGAAGAIIAPLAGRLSDKRGPGLVAKLGASLVSASFVLMLIGCFLPPMLNFALLVIAVIGFDLGVQATLIAHQTIIYQIDPGARSRLNAVLFTVMFLGMATGAGVGSLLMAHWGWFGVSSLAVISSLGALLLRLSPSWRN